MRLFVCLSFSVFTCLPAAAQVLAVGQDEPPQLRQLTTLQTEEELPQPRRRNQPAADPFAPQGIRTGAFTLLPQIEIGAIATSNARQTVNGNADLGGFLRPSIAWQSDWPRHSWSGSINGNLNRYLRDDQLRADSLAADTNFRLDIRRDIILDLNANYEASFEVDGADNPLNQNFGAAAALTKDLGRIQSRTTFGVARSISGDTDTENNADRARTDVTAGLRLAYRTDGIFSPFIGATYAPRIFDQKIDRDGLRRSSQGFNSEIGVAIADEPFWTGEVALTHSYRKFEDATLGSENLLGINAALTWRPTEISQVRFTASSALNDGEVVGETATREWNAGINLTHDLRDNVEAFAGLTAEIADAAETDLTFGTRAGVNWTFNPYLVWQASYEGTWFRSGASSDENYNDQRVLTSIILRY